MAAGTGFPQVAPPARLTQAMSATADAGGFVSAQSETPDASPVMLLDERKQGAQPHLAESRSKTRPIRSRREFCLFVEGEVSGGWPRRPVVLSFSSTVDVGADSRFEDGLLAGLGGSPTPKRLQPEVDGANWSRLRPPC